MKPLPSKILGECSTCAKAPRLLDPDTQACAACLARHQLMTDFFRLVRANAAFKLHSRKTLSPRKQGIFDAMFGVEDEGGPPFDRAPHESEGKKELTR